MSHIYITQLILLQWVHVTAYYRLVLWEDMRWKQRQYPLIHEHPCPPNIVFI